MGSSSRIGVVVLSSCLLLAVGASLWVLAEDPASPAAAESLADASHPIEPGTGELPRPGTTVAAERASAPQPLTLVDDPEAELARLILQLEESRSASVRIDATLALEGWVPGAAEAALAAAALRDADASVREAAFDALLDAESTVALEALAKGFNDPNESVRVAAENGLYMHSDTGAATGVLAALCASADTDTRIRAAEVLDEMTAQQLPWDDLLEGPTQLDWAPASPLASK
ncbi:MAG: hypothetical protein DHS20C15_31070 [Planctomycetota bacterium]|nr:MAG: hypothetical protein DHS20C15_31070 [Planctomycetota bacterium]